MHTWNCQKQITYLYENVQKWKKSLLLLFSYTNTSNHLLNICISTHRELPLSVLISATFLRSEQPCRDFQPFQVLRTGDSCVLSPGQVIYTTPAEAQRLAWRRKEEENKSWKMGSRAVK